MRHLTIIKSKKSNLVDPLIATITSNSFGDQIIAYRKYVSRKRVFCGRLSIVSEYVIMTYDINTEGYHKPDKSIVTMGKALYKQ